MKWHSLIFLLWGLLFGIIAISFLFKNSSVLQKSSKYYNFLSKKKKLWSTADPSTLPTEGSLRFPSVLPGCCLPRRCSLRTSFGFSLTPPVGWGSGVLIPRHLPLTLSYSTCCPLAHTPLWPTSWAWVIGDKTTPPTRSFVSFGQRSLQGPKVVS